MRGSSRNNGIPTYQVISLFRSLFLTEVAHYVAAAVVALAQYVEEKQIDVVVERLVIQEQLREVAQILTVDLFLFPIHFKHAQRAVAINFIPYRKATCHHVGAANSPCCGTTWWMP
eukprot:scaffold5061_cov378-Prasinococcus_capsulatus_cf.AAC.9